MGRQKDQLSDILQMQSKLGCLVWLSGQLATTGSGKDWNHPYRVHA